MSIRCSSDGRMLRNLDDLSSYPAYCTMSEGKVPRAGAMMRAQALDGILGSRIVHLNPLTLFPAA